MQPYSTGQQLKEKMTKAKEKLSYWIFAMLSTYSTDEFIYLVKHCQIEPALSQFKSRLDNARELYTQINTLATEKQQPHVGKSFFYGIKFVTNISDCKCQTIVELTVDVLNVKEAHVTEKIPTVKEFGRFDMTIARVLETQNESANKINQEMLDAEVQNAKTSKEFAKKYLDAEFQRKEVLKDKVRKEQEEKLAKVFEREKLCLEGSEEGEIKGPENSMTLETLLLPQESQPTMIKIHRDKGKHCEDMTREAMKEKITEIVLENTKPENYEHAKRIAEDTMHKAIRHGKHGR